MTTNDPVKQKSAQEEMRALVGAINSKNLPEVQRLLKSVPTVDFSMRQAGISEMFYSGKETPIFMALKSRDESVVDALLAKNPDLSGTLDRGGNLLLESLWSPRITKALIARGLDVNQADENGDTPVYFAILGGKHEVTLDLISAGATIVANDPEHPVNNIACAAAESLDVEMIDLLAEKGVNFAGISSEGGSTAIFHACAFLTKEKSPQRFCNTVARLAELGSDINRRTFFGETPAHFVATFDQPGFLKGLVEAGADLSIANDDGKLTQEIASKPCAAYLASLQAQKAVAEMLKLPRSLP